MDQLNPDEGLCADLAARLTTGFGSLLTSGEEVVMLDFPNHANCGDSAIWAGEIAVLEGLGVDVRFRSRLDGSHGFDAIDQFGGATVLLHGGGNTGNLWSVHSRYRESVLERSAGRRVVQLPQTIEESAHEHLGNLNRLAGRLERFTFMVRDLRGLELLEPYGNIEAVLSPDAAFGLHPVARTRVPRIDVLAIMRSDHETLGEHLDRLLADGVVVDDWLVSASSPLLRRAKASLSVRSRSLLTKVERSRRLPLTERHSQRFYDTIARRRTRRGMAMVSNARVVITDRLHGHIFCLLLGVPHVVLDTTEGKIRRFRSTFTADAASVTSARSMDEALSSARIALAAGQAPGGADG